MNTEDDQGKPGKPAKAYKPTANQAKILEVMLNPDCRFLGVGKQCELAGVERSVHYRAFRDPEFVEHYRKESRALVVRALGPVINAQIREALGGSTPAAKVILGMAGEYSEKQDVRILDKNGEAQSFGGMAQMSDEEIEAELARYERIGKATKA